MRYYATTKNVRLKRTLFVNRKCPLQKMSASMAEKNCPPDIFCCGLKMVGWCAWVGGSWVVVGVGRCGFQMKTDIFLSWQFARGHFLSTNYVRLGADIICGNNKSIVFWIRYFLSFVCFFSVGNSSIFWDLCDLRKLLNASKFVWVVFFLYHQESYFVNRSHSLSCVVWDDHSYLKTNTFSYLHFIL